MVFNWVKNYHQSSIKITDDDEKAENTALHVPNRQRTSWRCLAMLSLECQAVFKKTHLHHKN
jgi:hypothetical protein